VSSSLGSLLTLRLTEKGDNRGHHFTFLCRASTLGISYEEETIAVHLALVLCPAAPHFPRYILKIILSLNQRVQKILSLFKSKPLTFYLEMKTNHMYLSLFTTIVTKN
jgi:hypothetical protein